MLKMMMIDDITSNKVSITHIHALVVTHLTYGKSGFCFRKAVLRSCLKLCMDIQRIFFVRCITFIDVYGIYCRLYITDGVNGCRHI